MYKFAKHNLFSLKRQLELQNRKTYTLRDMAKATGIAEGTLHNLSGNKTSRVDLDIVVKLLNYFASENMPITINDLFTVTQED